MSTTTAMPEKQSEIVTVRICGTDRAALKAAADRSGTTCSYLLRLAVAAIVAGAADREESEKAVA